MNSAALYQHRWLMIRLPLAVLALALASLVWVRLYPMPPTKLTISTGLGDGAYQLYAKRYVEAFGRRGIELTVLVSEGSSQNLERLQAKPPAADLALVQGGYGWSSPTSEHSRDDGVQTLASVDIEALWLFSRNPPIRSLLQLSGLRVAAGPERSGHRVLLQRLLTQQRIGMDELIWSDLSGLAASEALTRGEIDAVFMVASPTSPGVMTLLVNPSLTLATLQRTTAIAERNNYLESRLLPQDGMGPNLPPSDTPMLTTPAHLLVRQDLDPALKRIATAVAVEVHGEAGAFHRAGEFPSLRSSDFPSAPEARQVLLRGLGTLENLLPFWWVQVLQRLLIICVPLLLLTLALFRVVPAWVRWRLESRITRWYGELKFIENDLINRNVDVGGMELSRIDGRLREMDLAIGTLKLPKELAQRWYTLHQHVDFVRSRIRGYRGR
ncbi:TAXI family TRAP transporter solute-binding subunit [Hydrogenophaga sp.]|uniref:TAXI family TRAP transporter solute-binding subunit n=1 Tax=Hydrogenophaga sp. TaxID=1904254 RepID=UPI00271FE615|nr:TAXI family TRAP transporter solute-binding subunit [Hydrogenophaga sp.]MDO8903696.1 TAXI family TRAP transporter solute-binding subunit [Hydrogenophaga sp.]